MTKRLETARVHSRTMFASRAARGDYDRQDTHNTPKRGSVSRKLKTSMEITKSPTMSPKTKTPVNLSRTDLGANFYRKLGTVVIVTRCCCHSNIVKMLSQQHIV